MIKMHFQRFAETRHMRLPTIIELIDMSETTHQKISKVDIDEAIFQPFPSEIIFQNFKPFETYQVSENRKSMTSSSTT